MSHASSQTPRLQLATFADLLAIPEEQRRHEILDGAIVEKAHPSGEHGFGQGAVIVGLGGFHGRPGGALKPGGWWLATAPSIELAPHQVVEPDVAGWRRDRHPARPEGYPVQVRPDWVCEVGTNGDARRRDGVTKRRIYADHGVPHYWLLDVQRGILSVLRLVKSGYTEVFEVTRIGTFRAEPFDEIELSIAILLGED